MGEKFPRIPLSPPRESENLDEGLGQVEGSFFCKIFDRYPGKLGDSSRLLRVDYYGTAGVSCVDDCDVDDCDYLAEG